MIAGLLDPPGNISVVSISYSSIHLQWTAPFSLLITSGINTNVTYFVVRVLNKFSREVVYEMTNQSEYVYHRRDYVHCSGVVFNIAAVNQVGRGGFSKGIDTGFDGRK